MRTVGSILAKESYIASPGFNRWLVPPAALCIYLCIGTAYGFPNLALGRAPRRGALLVEAACDAGGQDKEPLVPAGGVGVSEVARVDRPEPLLQPAGVRRVEGPLRVRDDDEGLGAAE